MNWYLIHTKPKQEQCALLNLQQQDYECYLPMLPSEKVRQGKLAVIDEPLFPRYLFIRLSKDQSAKSWSPIRSTRGVNRLVSFGREPAQVDDQLVESLQTRNTDATVRPLYTPGEPVRLVDTPYAALDAIYQMSDGESRVMVLIELLNKPVKLTLSPVNLRKIN